MLARTSEGRRSARRWVRRNVQIIVGTHVQQTQCVLQDISDGGARLSFRGRAMDLPRNFTLALYEGSVRRECEVVWSDGRFVGVKFISKWQNAKKVAQHIQQGARSRV